MKGTTQLKRLRDESKTLHVVGAQDAFSAIMIEGAGFDAVYVGSYSTQAAFLGKLDLDLMTKTERLMILRNIVKAVNVPVIADMEEGYGNAINVMDSVRDFEAVGVAAVHIDDEQLPGKCPVIPNIPHNRLISTDEMCGKIRAATNAREDPDFMIIARTDVVGTMPRDQYYQENRMEDVVKRSNAYAEAGADAIMIMGFNTDELSYYADNVRAPLVGLYASAEPIAFSEFENRNYFIAIGTIAALYMYARGLMDGLRDLKETGDWNAVQEHMINDEEFFKLLDMEKYQKLYQEYSIS